MPCPGCLAACPPHLQGQRAFVSLKAVAEAFPSRPVNMTRAYLKDACDLAVRVGVGALSRLALTSPITAACSCHSPFPCCFPVLLLSPCAHPRCVFLSALQASGDSEVFYLKDGARPPSEAELRKKLTPGEAAAAARRPSPLLQ